MFLLEITATEITTAITTIITAAVVCSRALFCTQKSATIHGTSQL